MTYGQDVISYGQAAVIAVIVLFYVPAVAMVWAARHHRTTHPERHPRRDGWSKAGALTLLVAPAVPILAMVATLQSGSSAGAVVWWIGPLLLPLAALVLAIENVRWAIRALVIWAFMLPLITVITGRWWLIDGVTGEPNPQSVGLGTGAFVLFFAVPALFSAALFGGSVATRDGVDVAADSTTTNVR